jgi:XTP/dITP diphosphohydrolase
MSRLVVATGNPGKLAEMQAYLTDTRWELRLKPADLEVEETGETFMANACLKASQVAQALGEWAIADDSGLEVAALGGAPGVYSARYGRDDGDRIARLLGALMGQVQRQARFVCAVAVASPDGAIVLRAEGICPGEILTSPQGGGGFGYDPLFYMPEHGLTFAEMPAALKHEVSHRGRAFQALLPQLNALQF